MTSIIPADTGRGEAPIIEFRGIEKAYGRGDYAVHALDGVDLTIKRGEFVSIMGASGSGKSTAMNVIGCLDAPTAGDYLFRGVNIADLDQDGRALLRRHFIGFVFQAFNLLARTSALENVQLPLVYRRVPASQRRIKALEALELVGLSDRASHTSAEMSGGQKQRVAIARALVTEPSLLLADEPTGNLDSTRSFETMELLAGLNRDHGITIVMVTHEADMAKHGRRTIHFKDGQIVSEEATK